MVFICKEIYKIEKGDKCVPLSMQKYELVHIFVKCNTV